MLPETLTSAQNPKIKSLLALQEKSKLRREKGLFVLEGAREFEHCLECGYEAVEVFFCPEILGCELPHTNAKYYSIPPHLYEKIAYRGGTEGVIAVLKCKCHSLSDIKLSKNPLVTVLESVEKPGNLGAVLRTADAAGADAVVICDPLTDLYNPNLIRSSLGGIFTCQCVAATSEDTIKWLKDNGIRILTAQLQDSSLYYDTDMKCGTAIIIGTESTGLTDTWRKAADAHIRIPMLGRLDSLNASVSASILLYEAVRQRHQK